MSDMITDCESLLGQSSLSGPDGRRGFLKVALGTGFAVAVLPVAAQNIIKTDSAGLVTGSMSVMDCGSSDLSRPIGGRGRLPGRLPAASRAMRPPSGAGSAGSRAQA